MSGKPGKGRNTVGGRGKAPAWLDRLLKHVNRNRLAVLRFSEREWQEILGSRRGVSRFTVARPHPDRSGLRTPTACLVIGREMGGPALHFGMLASVSAVTTLDTRLKVVSSKPLSPEDFDEELIRLVDGPEGRDRPDHAFGSMEPLEVMGSAASAELVERLARNEENWPAMRDVGSGLEPRRTYGGPADLQTDAVASALKAFGVSLDDGAVFLSLGDGAGDSALERVRISEDAVIGHDARVVDGFRIASSDLTGRAVFVNGDEALEVITANRQPLEEVLGVDLIYVNATMRNVVMVQYKMLEAEGQGRRKDWVFRPDAQFRKEVARMREFACGPPPGPGEYRINSEVFYLKFVRRDAALGRAPIIIPMDHFERMEGDPAFKGPRGGFRVSYGALGGRYLRQDAFLGLVRFGYIGAYSEEASAFTRIIDAILEDGRGMVAAFQAKRKLRGT